MIKPNPCHPNGQEYSFRPSRFIPLNDTRKVNLELEKDKLELQK